MSRDDVKKILMMIQAAYPNFKPDNKTVTINTWDMMLKEYEYIDVENALRAYISTDSSGFAPSIGQIIGEMQHVNSPPAINEMQAWAMVRQAINNSSRHSVDEFNKLPSTVQRAIGQASQLRMWALDDGFNEQVISSNFMRSYRAEVQRESEYRKLPRDIRFHYKKIVEDGYKSKTPEIEEDTQQEKSQNVEATKGISESTKSKLEALKRKIKEKNL